MQEDDEDNGFSIESMLHVQQFISCTDVRKCKPDFVQIFIFHPAPDHWSFVNMDYA